MNAGNIRASRVPIDGRWLGDSGGTTCQVENISLGGCFVRTSAPSVEGLGVLRLIFGRTSAVDRGPDRPRRARPRLRREVSGRLGRTSAPSSNVTLEDAKGGTRRVKKRLDREYKVHPPSVFFDRHVGEVRAYSGTQIALRIP